MTKSQDRQDRQATALFRYGLIADLIHLPAGSRGQPRAVCAAAREGRRRPLDPG